MLANTQEISTGSAGGGLEYRRRNPESTVLYRVLQEHLETFLARIESDQGQPSWPEFVKRELRAYLSCGVLCRGFCRIRCDHCCNDHTGCSALGLQRVLGLGSYQTAWAWLHKLRRAMVRTGRDRLRGCVEVDETYVGGEEEGVRGRETENKAIVAVAAEEDGRGIGRIRLRRILDVSAESLHPFVEQSVAPGSVIHTDGWPGYSNIETKGYTHKVTVLSQSDEPAHQLMPRVHQVASLLKRWLLGTHQGAVSNKHLDYYLDEYTFRFNRRRSRARGLLFYRLLQNAVAVDLITYRGLVSGKKELDPNI